MEEMMTGKIEHQVEEQCTPSELYLAMLLTYRSEDCPLLCFEGRTGPMPFCDCKIEKGEDGQTVINCEKMEGDHWVLKMGMCWIRYARQQAKSADAQTIERQIWRETGKATCEWLDLDVDEPDYKDAAEFEARVAALLATQYFKWFEHPCECGDGTCHHLPCPPGKEYAPHRKWCRRWCKIKFARLAVEQEMEEQ